MKRSPKKPSTSGHWPGWAYGAALFFVSGVTGCVDVSGGAVELSWSLATADGEAMGCDETHKLDTASVQLRCASTDGADPDPCNSLNTRFPMWSCRSFGGSTRFEIPKGSYQFSIAVLCEDPDPAPALVRVPDPIVRDILVGEVAQLNALLIEVPGSQTVPEGACIRL